MIRACLSLLAGVYALQLNSFAGQADPGAITMLAFVAAVALRQTQCGCFFAGLAAFASLAGSIVDARLPPDLEGDSIVVAVRIADFPGRHSATTTFFAEPLDDDRLPARLRLAWFEPPVAVRFGDVWRFELRLRRPRGNRNPGTFDVETWLFRQAIGATGYVVDGQRNVLVGAGKLGPIDRLRRHVVERIGRVVTDPRKAAVLAAIAVGARHLIADEQWERYARTGTTHLMAISGLHIGLAAGGTYFMLRFLGGIAVLRGCHRTRATTAALGVAVIYAFISGFALPAQRATLMIAIAAIAAIRRRRPRPLPVVAATCSILLLADPVGSLAPGFKLSFCAVLVLAWIARRYRGRTRESRTSRLVRGARDLAGVQLYLLIGLLPLTIALFGRMAFTAPWVNFLAVPLFGMLAVPLTFAGLLFAGPAAVAGDALLHIAASTIGLVEGLLTIATAVPAAAPRPPRLTGIGAVCLFVPAAWVLLPAGWPGRHVAWLGLLAVLTWVPARPAPGCATVDVLDVGQGLAVVVQTRNRTLLFDTGPAWRGGGSAAEKIVIPYLQSLGVERIDTLVISHADLDHAGGLAAIRSGFAIGRVTAGEPLPLLYAGACRSGDYWRHDGVDFRILHPPRNTRLTGNDASCVLLVSAGTRRVLLAGDIEKRVESELVRAGMLPQVSAAIVPHHGSRTSSSRPFVEALRPQVAIVAAGYRNRWGFPKPDVVARWQAAGATVAETARDGMVSLEICKTPESHGVLRYRNASRRIWHE